MTIEITANLIIRYPASQVIFRPTLVPFVITDTQSSPSPELISLFFDRVILSSPSPEFVISSVVKFRKRISDHVACHMVYVELVAFPNGSIVVPIDKVIDILTIKHGMAAVEMLNTTNEGTLKAIDENTSDTSLTNNIDSGIIVHKKKRGGWTLAFLLLANQGLATLAFFGVGVNLVVFLTRVLHQDNATAANNVSIWTGTVYLCSLIGAFLSDSYWGRFKTCMVFQVLLVMGLVLLSITSGTFLIKPKGCGDLHTMCTPNSSLGVALFYLSIYLIALGYGGHQPSIATFGADQFDDKDPNQKSSKALFFCYFYFALNVGSLFSNTILVYFEDKGHWVLGFMVSVGAASLALCSYFIGTSRYRYIKPCGNPLPRIAQVFVASARKWDVVVGNGTENLYEVEGTESAIKGSRKILHSGEMGFLDKAATITENDVKGPINNWRLCTITQVEEAKCILKMLPIWLCTIIYSVVFTQMASLFVEQGVVMKSNFNKFHLPAASMSAFDICSVLLMTGIYQYVVVPLSRKLTKNPNGLTELQRMGVGLIIGMLAMVAAGITENQRLKHVKPHEKISSMSIMWQIPQYALVGASEVFMYVGQLEFFNGQAPDGVKSFGSSLCMASISLGNYTSSVLVNWVMAITARGGNPGWIPENLNHGKLDRFYFLIAILTGIDFVAYLLCARWYNYINLEGDEQLEASVQMAARRLDNDNDDYDNNDDDDDVIRRV